MAISTLGHEFNVLPRRKTVEPIPDGDLSKLSEVLDIRREEPEQLIVAPEPKEEVEEVETKKQQIENAITRFEDFLKAAEQMQKVLGQRLKDRQVRVDPKTNPAVREAIRRVFGIDSDTVTYDMFKQALEIRSRITKEEREQTYGTRT